MLNDGEKGASFVGWYYIISPGQSPAPQQLACPRNSQAVVVVVDGMQELHLMYLCVYIIVLDNHRKFQVYQVGVARYGRCRYIHTHTRYQTPNTPCPGPNVGALDFLDPNTVVSSCHSSHSSFDTIPWFQLIKRRFVQIVWAYLIYVTVERNHPRHMVSVPYVRKTNPSPTTDTRTPSSFSFHQNTPYRIQKDPLPQTNILDSTVFYVFFATQQPPHQITKTHIR
jgi:hypothetical protein